MKKIEVIVKDLTTLELTEDAQKGDIIDLKEVVKVDPNYINNIIEIEKDKIYRAKFESERKTIELEYERKLDEEKRNSQKLREDNSNLLKIKELEIKEKYSKEISELQQKYALLVEQTQNLVKNKEVELNSKYINEITLLKAEIDKVKISNEVALKEQLNELKDKYEEKLRESETKYELLKREKSALNVKNIGEDLEKWCDAQMSSYMQNGFSNCKWYKDNKVVREESETKGSKADFIFEIYKDDTHADLLSSVCLEMKDENPDSVNKQTDSHYFKKLDENRNKKGCKYAVLVSNLESDNPNIVPIYKVNEYPNMYVVRPAYMMVLLNFITSLTATFAKVLMLKEQEDLLLKDKRDIIDEFNSIKNTYLDKPLQTLENQVNEILKASESLVKTSRKIDEACATIIKSYINVIQNKINKFEISLEKQIVKKMN